EGEGEGEGVDPEPSTGCGRPLGGGEFSGGFFQIDLVVDGIDRQAMVRLPNGYDANEPYPVVYGFHGDQDCQVRDGDACSVAPPIPTNDVAGLASRIGSEAILVSIAGENLNRFFPDFSWDTVGALEVNPDVQAIRAFRARLDDDYCVDTTRSFAVGFSGGGFFTNAIACYGEAFTAIAVFEGGFEDGSFISPQNRVDLDDCVSEPLPALIVHDRADTTVPLFYGQEAFDFWADNGGCGDATFTTSSLDPECEALSGCALGDDLVLCTVGTAHGPQRHEVWAAHGSTVAAAFFRRFF
ncbi:MAG TPA: hypothetical protein VGF99_05280, partial [Myxococcota bacterium]